MRDNRIRGACEKKNEAKNEKKGEKHVKKWKAGDDRHGKNEGRERVKEVKARKKN